MTTIFYSLDSNLKERNFSEVRILRELTADETDTDDVGTMYKIKFNDGFITDAYDDELFLSDTNEDGTTDLYYRNCTISYDMTENGTPSCVEVVYGVRISVLYPDIKCNLLY